MQLLTATRLLPELEELFVGIVFMGLFLDENQISWVGLINIVDVKWKKMMRLHLSIFFDIMVDKNLIGSTGIKLLIKAHLPILSILSLSNSHKISRNVRNRQRGNKTPHQRRVAILNCTWLMYNNFKLGDNNISCDGCQAITMGNYKNLESLWLTCNDQIDSVIFLGFVCGSYSKTKITTKKISNSKLK